MSVLIITISLRKWCHNNKRFSKIAPHHRRHRNGMKKLRHCHPMYFGLDKHTWTGHILSHRNDRQKKNIKLSSSLLMTKGHE